MLKSNELLIHEIFMLIREGNRDGVEMLYKHHYNKMYGVAFSILKNEQASQDVVHNVIYKLMKIEPKRLPLSSELSWLYTVTKNEALQALRSEKPTASIDEIVLVSEDISINNFVDMEAYYSMIKGLNEEQKQIVTLKVIGGFTHKEIAKMLGKPIGTVQWIFNTSIKKLKAVLLSFFACIFLSIIGFAMSISKYLAVIKEYDGDIEESFGQADELVIIPFDYSIIAWGVAMLLLVIGFIVFYKKTDKIPTKAEKKSI